MNAFTTFLNGAPAWFMAILDLSLQAALLCAIVFLITKTLGRWIPPNWRALLWFIVLARVLFPFSPPSALSFQNLWRKTPPPPTSIVYAPRAPTIQESPIRSFPIPTIPVSSRTAPKPFPIGQFIALTWAAGAVFFLLLLILRCLAIHLRLARNTSQPPTPVLEILKACAAFVRLRYPVRVSVSNNVAAPALTGFLPARLILPHDFAAAQFTPAQTRHILLHELAHIQQGHLILHWLALIARALHWFNPFIHFAAARLRHECELAADAAALRNSTPTERVAYAETILAVLAQTTAPRTLLALSMAPEARHMERRLRALTQPAPRSFRLLGATLLVTLAICGLSSAENPNQIQTPNPTPPPPKPVASPESDTPSPAATSEELAEKKVQNARLLIELGRIDEAERLLSDALHMDAENRAALYYSQLINEQKERNAIRKDYTNAGVPAFRDRYQKLLDSIRIEDFPLNEKTDLLDVLRELGSEIKKRDRGGRGLNFLIAQAVDRPAKVAIDPLTGQPPATPEPAVDVEKFQIKFKPPIHDLTLRQFLDAIVSVAEPPPGAPSNVRLRYSIEDYAVVFSQLRAEPAPLFTRTFRIDPNTFRQGLEGIRFSPTPNGAGRTFRFDDVLRPTGAKSQDSSIPLVPAPVDITAITNEVRAFFAAAGLEFPFDLAHGGFGSVAASSKALFYNDQLGVLFVRAPLADLDKIENLLHLINAAAKPAEPPK